MIQYATALIRGAPQSTSPTGKEILADQALLQIARAFDRGEPAPDAGDVASRLGSSAEEAGEVLAALRNAGLVVSLADGGLVPSRPPERLTLLDVRRALVGGASDLPHGRSRVAGIIREIEELAEERLAAVHFGELCEQASATNTKAASPPAPGGEAGEQAARRA